jgi:hypothetical protein
MYRKMHQRCTGWPTESRELMPEVGVQQYVVRWGTSGTECTTQDHATPNHGPAISFPSFAAQSPSQRVDDTIRPLRRQLHGGECGAGTLPTDVRGAGEKEAGRERQDQALHGRREFSHEIEERR